nr:hypothetical protein [Tanacetum cinerariifolium]
PPGLLGAAAVARLPALRAERLRAAAGLRPGRGPARRTRTGGIHRLLRPIAPPLLAGARWYWRCQCRRAPSAC